MTDTLTGWIAVPTLDERQTKLIAALEGKLAALAPATGKAIEAFAIDKEGRISGMQEISWQTVFELTEILPEGWVDIHDTLINKALNPRGWSAKKQFTQGKHSDKKFAGNFLAIYPHRPQPTAEPVEEAKT